MKNVYIAFNSATILEMIGNWDLKPEASATFGWYIYEP